MILQPGAAILRSSIGGNQSLRFTSASQLNKYPPARPADVTNTVVEKFHTPNSKSRASKGSRGKKAARATFLTPKEVSSNQFLAQAHDRYQGYQKGPTGTDRQELPLAWNPVYSASYRPDVAGSAFNQGAGEVADMYNKDTPLPTMDAQWHKKSSFLTPKAPNPFPIQLSDKFVLN
jgi:hypothetical protein